MYLRYFKRVLDFSISVCALIALFPLFVVLMILGTVFMGGNPFFVQVRPGLKENPFYLVKFRTMDNRSDESGNLLPDEVRLNKYGRFLRSTSLDELPELFNIAIGDMALVGPRPQVIRDMVFMSEEQRKRHDIRPGLTGLAQISGRNNITWEEKLEYDLKYINQGVTFFGDLKIIISTIGKVLRREDIVREGTVSDLDFGAWLLQNGSITKSEYDEKMAESIDILNMME